MLQAAVAQLQVLQQLVAQAAAGLPTQPAQALQFPAGVPALGAPWGPAGSAAPCCAALAAPVQRRTAVPRLESSMRCNLTRSCVPVAAVA